MEIDPKYADCIVTRYQEYTGNKATLEADGRTFDEIAIERGAAAQRIRLWQPADSQWKGDPPPDLCR